MTDFNRNPLHVLGEFSWADYKIFKAHLRLPRPYPYIIFKNYKSMHEATFNLASIVTKYNMYMWEKTKMQVTMKEKRYQAAGIPCNYHKPTMYITENSKDQSDIAVTVKQAAKLAGMGVNFYFHSEFSEGAMNAATDVLRSAVDGKLSCYCVYYPIVLDAIKTWDTSDPIITRIPTADVLLVWGVGSEYTTDFTNAQIIKILEQRKVHSKTTVVVSSLNPKEYKNRYGYDPEGAVVAFKDHKLKVTLSDIRGMLEGKDNG